MSDSLHAVRLLQGELVRLDGRRKRQIEKANADYRVDLLLKLAGHDERIIAMVQEALDLDRASPELAADLRHALWRKRNGMQQAEQDEHEADTIPPESDDVPPALPRPAAAPTIELAPLDVEFEDVTGTGRDPWDLGPETPRVGAEP